MMNTQIDSRRNLIFDDIIELPRLDHSRREAIESAVKRGVFDEKAWDVEQESLSRIWKQIQETKQSEKKMMKNIEGSCEEDADSRANEDKT